MNQLTIGGYVEAIKKHIAAGKPFLGICVGLQALFEGSEEDPTVRGLGLIPGRLFKFKDTDKSVPQIGWNSATSQDRQGRSFYGLRPDSNYYYVHSYAAPYDEQLIRREGWTIATGKYGDEIYVGAVFKDNVLATQFHPEKSGAAGLRVIKAFLDGQRWQQPAESGASVSAQGLTRRLVACLDVRNDESGRLVVTKGHSYDVRDREGKNIRNLGDPVDMARQYYEQGADEIAFLNITSFRNCPVEDLPMLDMLRKTSETVFVPLTIGGGIRDMKNPDGKLVTALEVATMYFKSGADKVSIGSDAVIATETFLAAGSRPSGESAIERISAAYGNQAVVVSIDPRRVYVDSPEQTKHHTIRTSHPGPGGEQYCWFQCTVKGGREGRDVDVRQLVRSVEKMGAGEILLNSIDQDGKNEGFDVELIRDVKEAVQIPVIASSGAGKPSHFLDVFDQTPTDAALGAGMVSLLSKLNRIDRC